MAEISEVKPFELYPEGSFPRELSDLINSHSIEGGSDTPDFILAEYLKGCLDNFDMCVRRREDWYGRKPDKVFAGEDVVGPETGKLPIDL